MIFTSKYIAKGTEGISMTHLHNTLTQTFASSATAVALLVGLGTVATPQAEAAELTCTMTSACSLSELLVDDNFFVVGDKKFGNFEYTPISGLETKAEDIRVFGEIKGDVFSAVFTGFFLAEPGGTTTASLSNTVEILDPNFRFKEVALSGNTRGNTATIKETVFDHPDGMEVADLQVDSTAAPGTLFDMEDVSEFKLKKIKVEKDIELVSEDGGVPSFSIFRQSYTQMDIPEPASALGILAAGGFGVALKRKRRNQGA
ncbi:MAG: PEP-CTERM sorting domain-containing protein [Cyanobacteriota bacterium]|nr:PEP-CTERM sorting domain-containing protein [Cyanobacteriota bacterium]